MYNYNYLIEYRVSVSVKYLATVSRLRFSHFVEVNAAEKNTGVMKLEDVFLLQ